MWATIPRRPSEGTGRHSIREGWPCHSLEDDVGAHCSLCQDLLFPPSSSWETDLFWGHLECIIFAVVTPNFLVRAMDKASECCTRATAPFAFFPHSVCPLSHASFTSSKIVLKSCVTATTRGFLYWESLQRKQPRGRSFCKEQNDPVNNSILFQLKMKDVMCVPIPPNECNHCVSQT